ncbi:MULTISPECIES: hypothetical protein [Nocardia]|uniref:Uncharacterized protein n=3 Tax=Nocardia TaxID=1817 RepID=U5E6U4_NOCAS|nr:MULTISPECIES: hypothetical protein [Nocardia]TDP31460.1 hypothetical protein DFR75_10865 [Nocardia ignorata]UGT50833.1 hypothetical protein LT345_09970 [Nocardia asteroides]SFN87486.1 hypothetical protein SAMN05444423_11818 [Nocardia asteroides]VEG36325.1 Uncharacterised protein [Nocardia asteroides]GAD82960.1 hypothetical protein NCAST_14_00040 [Nocardia asteroides NBRC 15531]
MTSADLNTWANNFSALRDMLDNYESEAARINPNSPNQGTSQLVAFQYGTCLSMLDLAPWQQKPAWLDAVEFGPTAGNEHKLLASRYVLEATLNHVDNVPLEQARTALRNSADRLEQFATRWAEGGVDSAELDAIATERRALASRAKKAAAAVSQQ